MGLGHRLYNGEASLDVVGRRKIWYAASLLLMIACVVSMVVRGFNFGIDFSGGNTFQFPATSSEQQQAEDTVNGQLRTFPANSEGERPEIATSQVVGSGGSTSILIKTTELTQDQASSVQNALAAQFKPQITERLSHSGEQVTEDTIRAQVSNNAVSASWGADISEQALIALVVFLAAVCLFLSIRYRWKMAVAAILALIHDLVLSAGVYSVVGFEVTPATVIGLLTILGFSLYDTVVVFDKIDENTKGILSGSRRTYSESANLAVNQTLMRSINTTIIGLLPVGGLLFVGAGLLGAGTLKDLALVIFVGMLAGAYSSIFLATPLVCDMVEREPRYADLRRKVQARRARDAAERESDTVEAGGGAEPRARRSARTRVGAGARSGRGPGSAADSEDARADDEDALADDLAVDESAGTDGTDDGADEPDGTQPVTAGTSPRPGARPNRSGGRSAQPSRRRPTGKRKR